MIRPATRKKGFLDFGCCGGCLLAPLLIPLWIPVFFFVQPIYFALTTDAQKIVLDDEKDKTKTQIVTQVMGMGLLTALLFFIFDISNSSSSTTVADFYPFALFLSAVTILAVVGTIIRYFILKWKVNNRL